VTLDWSELLREIALALGEADAANPDARTPCSQERLAQALQVPRGTLRNWLDGSEPRFSDGDRILAGWCTLTGKAAAHAPVHRAPLSARQREAVAGFRPAGSLTIAAAYPQTHTAAGAAPMTRSAGMAIRTPGAMASAQPADEQPKAQAAEAGIDQGTDDSDAQAELERLREALAAKDAELAALRAAPAEAAAPKPTAGEQLLASSATGGMTVAEVMQAIDRKLLPEPVTSYLCADGYYTRRVAREA
jgi:hypothetical protein